MIVLKKEEKEKFVTCIVQFKSKRERKEYNTDRVQFK